MVLVDGGSSNCIDASGDVGGILFVIIEVLVSEDERVGVEVDIGDGVGARGVYWIKVGVTIGVVACVGVGVSVSVGVVEDKIWPNE